MFTNIIKTKLAPNRLVKYLSQNLLPSINFRLYSDTSVNDKDTNLNNDSDTFKPRRACMYVPGDDEKKLLKIPKLTADCIILDCEDGVSINRKVEARETIVKHLALLTDDIYRKHDITVRINSADSGLADDDMNIVLEGDRLPNTLMLPKVEEIGHLDWLAGQMSSHIKDRFLNLIILVESAKGLMNLQSVCSRANELTEMGAPFRLTSVVFGSDDFTADIGAIRTEDSKELLYARQSLVTISKAFKLQAIDLVDIDFKDPVGLEKRSIESFHMGFTGKQVIHPNQVSIVQKAYTPSDERINWAKELLAEYKVSLDKGKGAFTFKGVMIDAPLVLQAKNVLRMVEDLNVELPKDK